MKYFLLMLLLVKLSSTHALESNSCNPKQNQLNNITIDILKDNKSILDEFNNTLGAFATYPNITQTKFKSVINLQEKLTGLIVKLSAKLLVNEFNQGAFCYKNAKSLSLTGLKREAEFTEYALDLLLLYEDSFLSFLTPAQTYKLQDKLLFCEIDLLTQLAQFHAPSSL